jgi:uncharacterized protein (DUF1810 family)
MPQLQRFLDAQDRDPGGYLQALGEMRAGRKVGHWIWYVFPQLRGLGLSSTSQFYGLDGAGEAAAYLQHDELRRRLLEIAQAVESHVAAGVPLATLMGSEVDATKLVSSMTLFAAVGARLTNGQEEANRAEISAVAAAADAVLDGSTQQGYPRCERTVALIEAD